jgi:hypothetical protein
MAAAGAGDWRLSDVTPARPQWPFWPVDLGPGAGHDGGRIVSQGTPAELLGADTLTAQHLRAHVRTAEAA